MKKKGSYRMLYGSILIAVQLLMPVGFPYGHISPINFAQLIFDAVYLLSANFIGVAGFVLLVWGICARVKENRKK